MFATAVVALSLGVLAAPQPPAPPVVTEIAGITVVHLRGDAHQRGFDHGRALGARVLRTVDDYAVAQIGPVAYGVALGLFVATARVDPALRAEARGLVAGLKVAGALRSRRLKRDLTEDDVLLVNAYTDLVSIACSSVSAWGAASTDGRLRVVRNLDWDTNPALIDNQVVLVFEPSEPDQQAVVSVGFAGYLGCLSCYNAAGVGAFFNMGYGGGAARPWSLWQGFEPANLLLRRALSAKDVDGDGRSTRLDVAHALERARHAGSYIVHVVDPAAALVMEVEHAGVARRGPSHDPRLPPEALVATNHLRVRPRAPKACRRYERARRAVSRGPITLETLWTLGTRLALPSVVHTLLFTPAERSLRLRLRRSGTPMSRTRVVDLPWSTLLAR